MAVNWWRRKERERDLERELRSHVEPEAEEQRGRGVDEEEARHAARRSLGNTALISTPEKILALGATLILVGFAVHH